MKYTTTRNWLLEKERYEDIIQFDASDQAKERFYCEMNGEPQTEPAKLQECEIPQTDNPEVLKRCIEYQNGIIKICQSRLKDLHLLVEYKDKLIDLMKSRLSDNS